MATNVAEKSRSMAVLVMIYRAIWCAGKSMPENNFHKRVRKDVKNQRQFESSWTAHLLAECV